MPAQASDNQAVEQNIRPHAGLLLASAVALAMVLIGVLAGKAEATDKANTRVTLQSVSEYPWGPGSRDWSMGGRVKSPVQACADANRRVTIYRGGRKIGSGTAGMGGWNAYTKRVRKGQKIRVTLKYRKVRQEGQAVLCKGVSKSFRIRKVNPPSEGY